MKIQLFTLLLITLSASCVGTKQFTGFVEPKFRDEQDSTIRENIVFDLTGLEYSTASVTSKKLKSQFIPAILYWQWNNTIQCDVSPMILGQAFQDHFLRYSESSKVQEKLQGRKLEMRIEKIPNSFVYSYKGNSIVFIFAYTMSHSEEIVPQKQNLVVNYKLTENGTTLKEGILTASSQDQPINNIWKSTKKFTWLYVDQFKHNNDIMAREIIERLITEI